MSATPEETLFPRASLTAAPRPALPPRFPRASRALPRNRQDDDSGALLLLAGFILGIALIVTGLTLSEVSQLENEAVREQDATFISEFRSVREKIGTALRDSVTTSTDPSAFADTFGNVADSFRSLETTRGYGFVAVLAGGDDTGLCTAVNNKAIYSECTTLTGQPTTDAACTTSPKYRYKASLTASDGTAATAIQSQCWDGVNDGILRVGGVIKGAYVYVHLDDPALNLEEVVLYKLN